VSRKTVKEKDPSYHLLILRKRGKIERQTHIGKSNTSSPNSHEKLNPNPNPSPLFPPEADKAKPKTASRIIRTSLKRQFLPSLAILENKVSYSNSTKAITKKTSSVLIYEHRGPNSEPRYFEWLRDGVSEREKA